MRDNRGRRPGVLHVGYHVAGRLGVLNRIQGSLGAAVAAAVLATAGGLAPGAAAAVSAGTHLTGAPVYDRTWSGYQAGGGRLFRFIDTTVTVPPRIIPAGNDGSAALMLSQAGTGPALVTVAPGGGPGSVTWAARGHASGRFHLTPLAGDQVAVSLYYDQQGNDSFTATDLTQHITQTVRVAVGVVVYDSARLAVATAGTVAPPSADTRLWQFTGSHLTTYTGTRGTITGPWTTSPLTATSDGTAHSAVKASPSFLWNDGQNFGDWLRADTTAYVVNARDNTVTPIITATNTALPPIPVGDAPDAIAITPDGKTAYVTNQGSGTVTPIDTTTNTALPPINVGTSGGLPDAIAITPDGKTAYVGNDQQIVPIDIATNTALTPIRIPPFQTVSMVITPDGKTLYAASDTSGTVTPINTATNIPLPPIKVAVALGPMAITPDGTTVYVDEATITGQAVVPISTATNTLLTPIAVGDGGAFAIAVTPDSGTAYVSNNDANTVTPIDTATNTALTLIPAGTPTYIAITPDGKTAYVATQTGNTGTVTPIETATNTALTPITVGGDTSPGPMAITPGGQTAYVIGSAAPDMVTPIDTATNTALAPIPVGFGPTAIAITP